MDLLHIYLHIIIIHLHIRCIDKTLLKFNIQGLLYSIYKYTRFDLIAHHNNQNCFNISIMRKFFFLNYKLYYIQIHQCIHFRKVQCFLHILNIFVHSHKFNILEFNISNNFFMKQHNIQIHIINIQYCFNSANIHSNKNCISLYYYIHNLSNLMDITNKFHCSYRIIQGKII